MRTLIRRVIAASPVVFAATTACLPYTVGTTAQTVPARETTRSTSWYFIPNAIKVPGDSIAGPLAGSNLEYRRGLDQRSDFGLRLLPGGVTADYKRRLNTDLSGAGTAFAYSAGGGIVNAGEHLMLQATLIASGREDASLVPYGGIRAMHVVPITQGAVTDKPTLGVFGGVQIGDAEFAIRPELGVFYDHSALGLRSRDLIFVPAITLRRAPRRHRAEVGSRRRPLAANEPRDPAGSRPRERRIPAVIPARFP
ncbi:MAG: hypothetical protein LH467_03440 [Gemmatimonadaceae bacterium]|nr:hypothetical protein [Gemmatimonadaceae bacterium]